MLDLSKVFKNAIINLYKKNVYTVDYAIIEASKLADKNKINAIDYEELITYLAEEQAKSMQEEIVEGPVEEEVQATDTTEDTAETAEDTTEESVVE